MVENSEKNLRNTSQTDKIPNGDESKVLLESSQNSNNIHIIKSSSTKDAEGKKTFFFTMAETGF